MKTLVVYDSLYGNTEIIARAIGDAIPGEVPVLRVGQVNAADLEAVDLLIIGSPTHGALPTEAVQDLLDRIGPPARESARAATFDTRLTWFFLERWGGLCCAQNGGHAPGQGLDARGRAGGLFRQGAHKGTAQGGRSGACCCLGQPTGRGGVN